MKLKLLIVIFTFSAYFSYSQNENFYSFNLDSIQYKLQRAGSGEEFSEIYSVLDSLKKPKYLIYVVISLLEKNSIDYAIDEFYENEKFINSLYHRLNCYPINTPIKNIRGNTLGFENQIEFENRANKIEMPGLLFSTVKHNRLYHILFMIPNQEMFLNHKDEIYRILNSLEI